MSQRQMLAAAAALALGVGCASEAQAQGFFEFLFGGRSQPSYSPYYEPEPLEMTVSPRKKKKAAKEAPPAPKLQTAIDPRKDPDWHLHDRTLRRGDIVVLKGQVLVFDGDRGRRDLGDFTALSRSKLVPASDKQRIRQMASPGGEDGSMPAKAADATSPEKRQQAAALTPAR